MIDVPAMFPDHRDEIPKSGELSDRGIIFSEMCMFVTFHYEVCFLLNGAVRIVFRHGDPIGAN